MSKAPKTRSRTASRVAAVQALFQSEQAGDSPETVIDQFVRHRLGELPSGAGFEDGRIPDAEVPLFSRIGAIEYVHNAGVFTSLHGPHA